MVSYLHFLLNDGLNIPPGGHGLMEMPEDEEEHGLMVMELLDEDGHPGLIAAPAFPVDHLGDKESCLSKCMFLATLLVLAVILLKVQEVKEWSSENAWLLMSLLVAFCMLGVTWK